MTRRKSLMDMAKDLFGGFKKVEPKAAEPAALSTPPLEGTVSGDSINCGLSEEARDAGGLPLPTDFKLIVGCDIIVNDARVRIVKVNENGTFDVIDLASGKKIHGVKPE